jgi:hypothetical protein
MSSQEASPHPETDNEPAEPAPERPSDTAPFLVIPADAPRATLPIRALSVAWLAVVSFAPLVLAGELSGGARLQGLAVLALAFSVPVLLVTEVACRACKQTRQACTRDAWLLLQSFTFT